MFRLRWVLAAALLALPAQATAGNFDWIGHVEADAEGLSSENEADRVLAVQNLSTYDPALSSPYLLKALDDDSDEVRKQAGLALAHGGVTEAAPTIIDWLGDIDAKMRAIAADILGELVTREGTTALIRSLGDSDATVRLKAVGSLGRIGRTGEPSVVVPLISRLDDDKTDVRRAAVEQLEAIGDKRAVIPMIAAVDDPSLEVRKGAVRALGTLGDTSAVPALLRLLDDSIEEIRGLAVASLGTLGATGATDELVDRLGTGSDTYRAKVALSLGQIARAGGGGESVESAVRSLVESLAVPNQRTAAREALRVAGVTAVPALIDHLDGRIDGDPREAVLLLRDAADARATAALVAELDRGRVPVTSVLEALAATGDPAAIVPVLGLTSSKDAELRLAAMNALRPLLGQDARAADVLIERLDDDELEVRVMAIEYLGLLRAPRAVTRLIDLAGPGNLLRVRLASIDALGEIADADATKVLVEVLREGPAALHASAATALSYIANLDTVDDLLELARDDRSASRHHVVRALGSVLRGQAGSKAADRARKLFVDLADAGTATVGIAAIAGLAAIGDLAATPALLEILDGAGPDRQRAAAWALGELHDTSAVPALVDALDDKDDRVTADVAWALGEIASGSKEGRDAVVAQALPALGKAAKKGGWATAIDATAALTRIGDPSALDDIARGIHHKSKLVRIVAVRGLGVLGAGGTAIAPADVTAMLDLLGKDTSPKVRIAVAQALAMLAVKQDAATAKTIADALAAAATDERDEDVRAAATAAAAIATKQAKPAPAIERGEWRVFYVVDPSSDDKPVREEPYFVIGDDGLVWATYTDARGEIVSEHFPEGDAVVAPASRETEY
jgi:HEAT repeat protein